MIVQRLPLLLRTVSHMKAAQVMYYIHRRILPIPNGNKCYDGQVDRREGAALKADFQHFSSAERDYQFEFINLGKEFTDGVIDWRSSEMQKLWRYNLHYFDFIHETCRTTEAKIHLINHWIEHNPKGSVDAWEPYTVSLRVVNWIQLFLNPTFQPYIRQEWLDSLFHQICWLENNLEYHILANHFLKNAKALFFAGMFFTGKYAERWLTKGLNLLLHEAHEQILDDGGHYERSPMYHTIVCQDYLDVLNIFLGSKVNINNNSANNIQEQCVKLLDFLSDICMPDGDIPLFNDSAFGIAAKPEKLFEYAKKLFGYRVPEHATGLQFIEKRSSGYFIVKNNDDMLIIDVGEVGPHYQPGHAHCDTLSFELCLSGDRIIVDTGVKNYDNNNTRFYARSTEAHNTVRVDKQEQSEIWDAFRVGRRAKPFDTLVSTNSGIVIEACHNGYAALKNGPVYHQRCLEYRDKVVSIIDRLTGRGRHLIESFVHIHPEINTWLENNIIKLERNNIVIAELTVISDVAITISDGKYFPEFGIEQPNKVITLSYSGKVPVSICYQIARP